MHGVWGQILDDDFIAAYRHGFVMESLDGVWRRFYPRIFTYAADYPEKSVTSIVHVLEFAADWVYLANAELSWRPSEITATAHARAVLWPKRTYLNLVKSVTCKAGYPEPGLMLVT